MANGDKNSNIFLHYIAPVIFTFLWAGGYSIAKIALEHTTPMTLLAMRFAAVVILLAPLCLIIKPRFPKQLKNWGHLIVVGTLMQAVYFGGSWWAFKSGVSAGVLAIFMSLQPIVVAILAPYLAREFVSWRRWLGLLLGLAGVVVVIAARADIEPPTFINLLFATIGLAGITAGVLYEKRFGISYHPLVSNSIQYGAAFFVVLPMAYFTEPMTVDFQPDFFIAFAYLVIGNSIIAISLLLAMIRAGEVARVSSLMFLVPPLAAFFGWLLLNEEMPYIAWAGMALAAVGVSIATRTKKRPMQTSENQSNT